MPFFSFLNRELSEISFSMTIVHEIVQFSQQKKGAVTPGNPLPFLSHILLIMHGNHFLFFFDQMK